MNRETLTGVILISTILHSAAVIASECQSWQDKIQRLEDLNSKGGKARQQALRRKKMSQYEAAYYQCRNHQTIQVTGGHTKIREKSYRQTLRNRTTSNLSLRQRIDTCNYWITQHNLNPSEDNRTFRDTACRAADRGASDTTGSPPAIAPRVNRLSECIKPNNRIDNDVNQCLQGKKEATWNQTTDKH